MFLARGVQQHHALMLLRISRAIERSPPIGVACAETRAALDQVLEHARVSRDRGTMQRGRALAGERAPPIVDGRILALTGRVERRARHLHQEAYRAEACGRGGRALDVPRRAARERERPVAAVVRRVERRAARAKRAQQRHVALARGEVRRRRRVAQHITHKPRAGAHRAAHRRQWPAFGLVRTRAHDRTRDARGDGVVARQQTSQRASAGRLAEASSASFTRVVADLSGRRVVVVGGEQQAEREREREALPAAFVPSIVRSSRCR